MAQKARASGMQAPRPFFLQKCNPMLCLVQEFDVLNLFGKAAQDLEQYMLCMRITIIL
jgi:hypothetical protein